MADVTANRIREILKRLSEAGRPVTRDTLAGELGVEDSYDRRRLGDALKQLVRRGELTIDDNGRYRFVAEASPPTTAETRPS